MAVDRARSQHRCPVCSAGAGVADLDGYLRCPTCELLFAAIPPMRYGDAYWGSEGEEAGRRERDDAFVRAIELIWLSRRPVERLLDFGCGYGETVRLLRDTFDLDAVGIDPFGQFSETTWLRRIDVDAALAEFGAASFDAVLSVEVFEHLPDPLAIAAPLARLLRPGGSLLVNTGTQEFLAEAGPDVQRSYLDPVRLGHVSIYSFRTLGELGARTGLELERMGARAYAALLVKEPRHAEPPLAENLALLGRVGPWFPSLVGEYLRLVDVERELRSTTAWAVELEARLRAMSA